MDFFRKRLDDLDSVIDRQEQYSRWNCLLLHDIEEESNDNTNEGVTDVLSKSMGATISTEDIDGTPRSPGKKPNEKSRPLFVNLDVSRPAT